MARARSTTSGSRPDPKRALEALRDAARGRPDELAGFFSKVPNVNLALVDVAIRAAGTEADRVTCAIHLQDRLWAEAIPLSVHEYSVLLPADPLLERPIAAALAQSPWGLALERAVRAGGERARAAAESALADMNRIASEAAQVARKLRELEERVGPPPTILQVQALARLERCLGLLDGKRILEVGAQDGGLLYALRRLGAEASAIDLQPEIHASFVQQGDFFTADLSGGYEAIVATAVFEWGSNVRGERTPDARNQSAELLLRFHELLVDGGVVALENILLPIPFSKGQAENAGFELVRELLPAANHASGGRGCTLRKRLRSQPHRRAYEVLRR